MPKLVHSFSGPLSSLLTNEAAISQAQEMARIFFSNSALTVNLVPAIVAALGAALCK